MVKNDLMGLSDVHTEDSNNPWFTPEGLAAAQYSDLAFGSSVNTTDEMAIDLWMRGPFHAVGILDPHLFETGFGSYREVKPGRQMAACLDVRHRYGSIPETVTFPIEWPHHNMSLPLLSYDGGEGPDPLTGCLGYTAPSGPPIMLQIGPGNIIPVVTSHSLMQGGIPLEHCVFDETSYTNPDSTQQNIGRSALNERDAIILIPCASFTAGANYTASITVNGQTYTWSFITENGITAPIFSGVESPEPGPVSGIAVIRGWAFATQLDVSISKVELFIDGVSAGDIPCCSQRADVQAAFPDNPNALNSGWATTFNWGVLDVGSYTVQVVIKNTLGQTLSTETRMVTVVKPGNFEFLDLFSLAQATALIDGDELVLEGVTVRDKATQQQKTIDAHYRWSSSSQSFGLIQSPTLAQSSPAPSLFAAWWSALLTGLKGLTTPTQASPGVIAAFESPEASQLAAGVGVVRGWAFSDTASATITEVRLVIDGTAAGTVPCCSARGDVAAAYPGIATALNSGWGAVFNYGILNAGPHTFGVQITDSTGATFSAPHGVTVVKLGEFEFLDQCTLSGATAQLQGEDIVLSGVQVRDKATQQSKIITIRVRWLQSAQALGIVASHE
jgi:hypothetical protein